MSEGAVMTLDDVKREVRDLTNELRWKETRMPFQSGTYGGASRRYR